MNLTEGAKTVGGCALYLVFVAASLALLILFLNGAAWVADKVLPILVIISLVVFAVCVVILLPLCLIHTTRPFAGTCLFLASYVFGITLWFMGLVYTVTLWGVVAAVIGMCFIGVGVVPIGMLALLFHGYWEPLIDMVVILFVTMGARFGGLLITKANTTGSHDVIDL